MPGASGCVRPGKAMCDRSRHHGRPGLGGGCMEHYKGSHTRCDNYQKCCLYDQSARRQGSLEGDRKMSETTKETPYLRYRWE